MARSGIPLFWMGDGGVKVLSWAGGALLVIVLGYIGFAAIYSNVGYRWRQTSEAAALCPISYNSSFIQCFEKRFPLGSPFAPAKKFLIDSGLDYEWYHKYQVEGKCHRFVWYPRDLTERYETVHIGERESSITSFSSGAQWRSSFVGKGSIMGTECTPTDVKTKQRAH
jgi:hypothetical protein